MIDEKESDYHEDEAFGFYDRFIRISSIEGSGSCFCEIAKAVVCDID